MELSRKLPKKGDRFRNREGKTCEILTVARHTETLEELVVFLSPEDPGQALAMPLPVFVSEMDRNPGKEEKRPAEDMKGTIRTGPEEQGDPDSPDSPEEVSPDLLLFLDAETCEEKLDVLDQIRGRLTDGVIDAIAVSLDTEIRPGEIDDRIREIRACLMTRLRFEGSRLRNRE